MNDATVMPHLRRSFLWLWTQQALGNALGDEERVLLDDVERFEYAMMVSDLALEVTK